MTKLIIQIPCFNEEHTLLQTLGDIPKSIEGVDCIEIQIVDDGSTDNTIEVAKQFGVHHIVCLPYNKGLATAFKAGVANALRNGADILVNTDGDNQYDGRDIAKLVAPILEDNADMVVGCRPILAHPEFSVFKKMLQLWGSWVLRNASKSNVRDAASGFRAYSLNALLRMNIYSTFSYCMETLIQAGNQNMRIRSVDVRINPKTRDSRLFKNMFSYVAKSAATIVHIFLIYRSKTFFSFLGGFALLCSASLVFRYIILINYYDSSKFSFWPSIILAGVLLALGVQFILTGVIASLISTNRQLLEEIHYDIRKNHHKG